MDKYSVVGVVSAQAPTAVRILYLRGAGARNCAAKLRAHDETQALFAVYFARPEPAGGYHMLKVGISGRRAQSG